MRSTTQLLLILIFKVFTEVSSGNVFFIERRRPNGGVESFQRSNDSFKIPFSLCNRTIGGDECQRYNAIQSGEECSCSCPLDRASFVYADNEWKCQENSRVRDLQVCSGVKVFLREFASDPRGLLYTLKKSDELFTNILLDYRRTFGWRCEVHLDSSWYLGCSSDRLKQSQYLTIIKELFTFRTSFIPGSGSIFLLEVKSGVQYASLLDGRIINLGFRCTRGFTGQQYLGCLMFKLFGQLTCPVSFLDLQTSSAIKQNATTQAGKPTPLTLMTTVFRPRTTTTLKLMATPTTTTTTITTTTTASLATTLNSNSKGTSVFDTSQITIDTVVPKSTFAITFAILSTHTVFRSTTSILPSSVLQSFVTTFPTSTLTSDFLPRPSFGLNRTQDGQSPSLALIAGITSASIVLLIVISAGLLVYRRCHSKSKSDALATKGKTETRTKETVVMSSLATSSNKSEDNDDDGYSTLRNEANGSDIYASNYCLVKDPTAESGNVYAPLNIPDGQNIYGHNPAEPVYNVLDNSASCSKTPFQNGPVSIEQPVLRGAAYYSWECQIRHRTSLQRARGI